MAQYEAHYSANPPERTDEGDTAAPALEPVFPISNESTLRHAEMHKILFDHFGPACWGCGFLGPDERYLELDHIDLRSSGGSNDLDNRALLCRPCNQKKSNNLTLDGLRRKNRQDGHLQLPLGQRLLNIRNAREWARQYLAQHRREIPDQLNLEGR